MDVHSIFVVYSHSILFSANLIKNLQMRTVFQVFASYKTQSVS